VTVGTYGSPQFTSRLLFLTTVCVFMVFAGRSVLGQTEQGASTGMEVIAEEFSDARDMMGTYVINPLDKLLIVVYAGEKQISRFEDYVKSDETIYLPFLEKDVQIGGLRILEAEEVLEKLSRSFIKEPRIVITVVSSYSQSVSTYGKIASRNIDLKTPMRILQLLARAGGLQEGARADSIRVISLDGSIRYFNYTEVNKNPTDENNFHLNPGDIVFVPSEEDLSVMVLGNVARPARYPMRNGSQLLDAILKAGSWGDDADIKKVNILSGTSKKTVEVKEVDITKIFEEGEVSLNYVLRDGDIIYIPTRRAPAIVSSASSILTIIHTLLTSYAVYATFRD